jgi:putative glutamine amidotransferase
MAKRPIILIPGNVIDYTGLPAHAIRDTYVRAVREVIGGIPMMLPVGEQINLSDIAGTIDGIMLTGSPSNVAPACYGAKQEFPDKELDIARDTTVLPLIKQAIDIDMPVMAICRGFQELNVAMGGTLHQKVHELPGKRDHRAAKDMPLKDIYELQAHKVETNKGGMFERIGLPPEFTVNTLHQQGIDKLGSHLHIEAVAEDGIIEAVSVPGRRFVLGTQWHPEGDWYVNKASEKILASFGEVVRSA